MGAGRQAVDKIGPFSAMAGLLVDKLSPVRGLRERRWCMLDAGWKGKGRTVCREAWRNGKPCDACVGWKKLVNRERNERNELAFPTRPVRRGRCQGSKLAKLIPKGLVSGVFHPTIFPIFFCFST